MSQLTAIKPFAEQFYEKIELLPGCFYNVQTRFNDSFMDRAELLALEEMKKEVFDTRYKDMPLEFTGDEKKDAMKKAAHNWTVVSFAEVIEYFGEFIFFQRVETAKLILACIPVNGEPPMKDAIQYIEQAEIDKVKSFFRGTTRSGSPPNSAPVILKKSSGKRGKAKKAIKG